MSNRVVYTKLVDIYAVLVEIKMLLEDNGHNSTGRGGLSDKQVEKGSIPLCPTKPIIPDCLHGAYDKYFIDDGFGSVWSIYCAECHKPTMQVVRPGKAQCGDCG